MPCIGVDQCACARVYFGKKDSDKGCELYVVNVQPVDLLKHLERRICFGHDGMESSLQAGHQDAGRNTLTADICHNESMRAIVEPQEVKVIAADDLCRSAITCNIKAGHIRNLLRQ